MNFDAAGSPAPKFNIWQPKKDWCFVNSLSGHKSANTKGSPRRTRARGILGFRDGKTASRMLLLPVDHSSSETRLIRSAQIWSHHIAINHKLTSRMMSLINVFWKHFICIGSLVSGSLSVPLSVNSVSVLDLARGCFPLIVFRRDSDAACRPPDFMKQIQPRSS